MNSHYKGGGALLHTPRTPCLSLARWPASLCDVGQPADGGDNSDDDDDDDDDAPRSFFADARCARRPNMAAVGGAQLTGACATALDRNGVGTWGPALPCAVIRCGNGAAPWRRWRSTYGDSHV